MSQEYAMGWRRAALWANRDDLIADIESPAYERDMAADLATLRQQAARVDAGMVERACRGFYGERWLRLTDGESPRNWMRAALEAALSAQPAPERQGDAIGFVMNDPATGYKYGVLTDHSNAPDNAKLYLHPAPPKVTP